jgi:hypothetical protein
VKEEKEPSLLSFRGGREGAVSETSPLMRWFENARYSTHYTRSPHRFASLRQLQERHVSVASASSHGPLTAR